MALPFGAAPPFAHSHLFAAAMGPSASRPQEFERLWLAFMTARVTLGLVLALLQGGLYALSSAPNSTPLWICVGYVTATLAVRLLSQPKQFGQTFDTQWWQTVGVDLLAFTALQSLESGSINYTPLFALPVLMASVLGTLVMAMGTAAGVTLLLFAYAAWQSVVMPWDSAGHFMQSALTGSGCFAISFVANQLAVRLASTEQRAQQHRLDATAQGQVNELVIATLSEGIVVIDPNYRVRSANPAALVFLDLPAEPSDLDWALQDQPAWEPLRSLVARSFNCHCAQQADITIVHANRGPRHLRVRTQMTSPQEAQAHSLCVVFMQDQREMQARLRTEKLASMGRMSAAVAHEIRNPLAAITQANALLAEDLHQPDQLRLTQMVQQNAHRLEKIVRDVLSLAHAPHQGDTTPGQAIDLERTTQHICQDWLHQNANKGVLWVNEGEHHNTVWFDSEHLRRVLVNLLDNASRHASNAAQAIQVSTDRATDSTAKPMVTLRVWSDGAPLEPAVAQHLFEPFFSSDSRSSGLGLHICRELCERHGASMSYQRNNRQTSLGNTYGNEFNVHFRTLNLGESGKPALVTDTP